MRVSQSLIPLVVAEVRASLLETHKDVEVSYYRLPSGDAELIAQVGSKRVRVNAPREITDVFAQSAGLAQKLHSRLTG